MNRTETYIKPVFIAWSHWACTSAAWQDYFRGEDEDPALTPNICL